jgi:hypothetical protein
MLISGRSGMVKERSRDHEAQNVFMIQAFQTAFLFASSGFAVILGVLVSITLTMLAVPA